jgi:hypothetical protein
MNLRGRNPGKPNPELDGIKEIVRNGGWSASAWRVPTKRRTRRTMTTVRVFALLHKDRRFVVRATSREAAEQILRLQLS